MRDDLVTWSVGAYISSLGSMYPHYLNHLGVTQYIKDF